MPQPSLRRAACRLVPFALLLAVVGCGLRTAPKPLSEVIPRSEGLQAWQREDAVTVSWPLPATGVLERFGGLRGFELILRSRPLVCVDCPPARPRRLLLPPEGAPLEDYGGRAYLALPLEPTAGRVEVQLRVRYGVGTAPPGDVVVVERAGDIPAPELRWRWVGADAAPAGAPRPVQFFWTPARERVVYVVGEDGHPLEQVRHYRANLYRRLTSLPWPPAPLHPSPLEGQELTLALRPTAVLPQATGEEFALRYVDRFGNEGPPSAPVRVQPSTAERS